jgi:EmrB/QacA subfamily drug resistance transporter
MSAISRVKSLIPWTIALGLFLESLDSTIITTAIPKIAESLHVGPLDLKIALTSYMLSIAVFIPISGWVAQKYGTRTVYFSAMLVFALGSIACGCAVNLATLIAARILQGMGGALMTPVARTVLVRVFSKQELLRVISYMTIPALIGPMLGPLAGGVITSYLSWRWVFFVNIPFVLLGLYIIQRFFINLRNKKSLKLDKKGYVLFAIASASLTFSLEMLGENYLSLTVALLILGLAITCLLAFYMHIRSGKQTLFDLKLFNIHSFKLGFAGNCWSRLGVGGMNFILPLFFQLGLGFSPLYAGLLMAVLALGLISMKFLVKRILCWFGFKRVLMINGLLLALSLLIFMAVDKATNSMVLALYLFVHGLIASLQYSSMNALVLADIPAKQATQASMMLSTLQQLGSSAGVGICGFLLGFFLSIYKLKHMSSLAPYHQTFCLLALLVCCAALPFWRLSANTGQKVSGHNT